MRKEFKRVGPLSLGLMYAMLTLIFAVIMFVLVLVFGQSILQDPTLPPEFQQMLNPAAVALILGVYIVFAFIAGVLGGLFYNLAASIVGGVTYTVRDLD